MLLGVVGLPTTVQYTYTVLISGASEARGALLPQPVRGTAVRATTRYCTIGNDLPYVLPKINAAIVDLSLIHI